MIKANGVSITSIDDDQVLVLRHVLLHSPFLIEILDDVVGHYRALSNTEHSCFGNIPGREVDAVPGPEDTPALGALQIFIDQHVAILVVQVALLEEIIRAGAVADND